jgi:hypothetical protein
VKAFDWQNNFTDSIFSGLTDSIKESFNTKDQALVKRFAIYQNNVFFSFTEALSDLYPVIKKLVGEDFFNGAANVYIRKHPPSQAAMVYFGSSFPEFLRSFEHTASMPYLVDIAELELKHHQAYHAADIVAMSADDFTKIEPEKVGELKLALHPSLSLLSSPYPIFSIWQSNQDEESSDNASTNNESINLDEPQSVIIVRHEYERKVFHVDKNTINFYHLIANKESISASAHSVMESATENTPDESNWDISNAIALGIQNGFFVELND